MSREKTMGQTSSHGRWGHPLESQVLVSDVFILTRGSPKTEGVLFPIGSMYAIYGSIYHQYTPNVSIYTPYMDPMGLGTGVVLLNPSEKTTLYRLYITIFELFKCCF